MPWSYDPTQLSGTSAQALRYQVRLEIGDIDQSLQLKNATLLDEEIDYFVSSQGQNVLLAAVHAAEALLSRWARKEVGTTAHQDSRRYDNLRDTLDRLRKRLAIAAGWVASGQSISGKAAVQQQTDRVPNAFERDQIDFPGTSETSGQPSAATDQTAP